MSFSLIRLSLYGLIVAIDLDLRGLVRDTLGQQTSIVNILSPDTLIKIKDRANRDGAYAIEDFYDYLDFPDSIQALNANRSAVDQDIGKMLKSFSIDLERLKPIRNRVMHARPLHFNDYATIDTFVRNVLKNYSRLFPNVAEFEQRVRENPNYVYSLDLSNIARKDERIPHNLPLPDYDETGFLGREREAADLLIACKSNWPVITIVGEGGFGKTALALKTAYTVLDDERSDFEAIVWVTAKRTVLTLDDIQVIDNSIQDSLGLIQHAATQLGGLAAEDVVLDEVANYLNTFKILLVLDNLETVLDPLLNKFIRKSSGKSKILATSRVGIGEMSYPFKLAGMSEGDAINLLRATARIRRVPEVYRAKADVLRRYVNQMKLNAGFIKWFVSSVQVGKHPDSALANPKVFLDFCLSNVYEHISQDGRTICKAMTAVPGRQSLALISYLAEVTGDALQEALAGLQSANIVSMVSVLTDAGAETAFELNELPRLYILRNHAPSAVEDMGFKNRKRDVTKLYERLQSDRAGNRYNMRSIACRNPADAVTGKLLSDAFAASASNNLDLAMRLVQQAKDLDASFYEVYRVEAALEVFSDRPALAEAAYQSAIAFEPRSAPLRFWYGGFLLRVSQDSEAAEAQLLIAAELDPKSPSISIELARVEMFLGKYVEADVLLESVFSNVEASTKQERMAYDTWIQVLTRQATTDLEGGRYSDALDSCKQVPIRFSAIPPQFLDERIVNTAKRSLSLLAQLIDRLTLSSLKPEAELCYQEIDSLTAGLLGGLELPFASSSLPAQSLTDQSFLGRELQGHICSVNMPKRYGFIRSDEVEVFFHFSSLSNAIREAKLGAEVAFVVGEREGRLCAVDVHATGQIVDTTTGVSDPRTGSRRIGYVKAVVYDKHFGFVSERDGGDLFFHGSSVIEQGGLTALSVGDLVSFVIGKNYKGIVADQISIEWSIDNVVAD